MLSIRSSPLPAISLTKLTISCLVLFCTISSKPLYVSPHCITNLSSQSQLFSLKYYFSIFFNQNNEFIFKVLTSFSKRKTTTKKLVKLVFPFCSCHQWLWELDPEKVFVVFYSVNWSSRAACLGRKSQWNVMGYVPACPVRSSANHCTMARRLVST